MADTLVVRVCLRSVLLLAMKALLRPGRFEVQIEVPLPQTDRQRISILKVHTKRMQAAGRLLVSDPPPDTAAAKFLEVRNSNLCWVTCNRQGTKLIATLQIHGSEGLPTYQALISDIATYCHGMSGASLAGVARAAASRALERIVGEYSKSVVDNEGPPDSMMDCVVTRKDFDDAIHDVYESAGNQDWEPTKDELQETEAKSASAKE